MTDTVNFWFELRFWEPPNENRSKCVLCRLGTIKLQIVSLFSRIQNNWSNIANKIFTYLIISWSTLSGKNITKPVISRKLKFCKLVEIVLLRTRKFFMVVDYALNVSMNMLKTLLWLGIWHIINRNIIKLLITIKNIWIEKLFLPANNIETSVIGYWTMNRQYTH